MKITGIKRQDRKLGIPVLPRSDAYPTGQGRNVALSFKQLDKRYAAIKKGVRELINSIPRQIVANVRYEYQIDADAYSRISVYLQQLFYDELLDSPSGIWSQQWWLNQNLERAYGDGTETALQSAKNVTPPAIVGTEISQQIRNLDIEQIQFTPGYARRVGLVKARVFENMKGLTDSSKSDLADTMARGMASGMGVRDLTKDVMSRVDVSKSRAERIARTEINNAYRTAGRDETGVFNDEIFGESEYEMQQLWFSALSPTTRRSHAALHGKVKTNEWVEEFYMKDGNAINCLCSQSPVLVNKKTGKPVNSSLQDLMEQDRAVSA